MIFVKSSMLFSDLALLADRTRHWKCAMDTSSELFD